MFPWCKQSTEARMHVVQYRIEMLGQAMCAAMIPMAELLERVGLAFKDAENYEAEAVKWMRKQGGEYRELDRVGGPCVTCDGTGKYNLGGYPGLDMWTTCPHCEGTGIDEDGEQ